MLAPALISAIISTQPSRQSPNLRPFCHIKGTQPLLPRLRPHSRGPHGIALTLASLSPAARVFRMSEHRLRSVEGREGGRSWVHLPGALIGNMIMKCGGNEAVCWGGGCSDTGPQVLVNKCIVWVCVKCVVCVDFIDI